MEVEVGSYTGDGNTTKDVSIGFTPDMVWVMGNNAHPGFRTTDFPANESNYLQIQGTNITTGVRAFASNQFTVGTTYNANTATYYYAAFRDDGNDDIHFFTYSGDGGSSRGLTGFGFQPCYAHIHRNGGGKRAVQRYKDQPSGDSFDLNTVSFTLTDAIKTFDSDGITLGANTQVNESGATYYGFAFAAVDGAIDCASYTGNSSDDRDIVVGGTAFQPKVVLERVDKDSRYPMCRWGTSGDSSHRMWNAAPAANWIQALNSNGFQVGNDVAVNENTHKSYYLALTDNLSGVVTASTSMTGTASATIDATVNENQTAVVSMQGTATATIVAGRVREVIADMKAYAQTQTQAIGQTIWGQVSMQGDATTTVNANVNAVLSPVSMLATATMTVTGRLLWEPQTDASTVWSEQ